MEQSKKDILTAASVDVNDALERLMGSEALFERLLKKFLEDSNFASLERAIDADDAKSALVFSHTLKGLCGNLSMTKLAGLFTEQTALLRKGDFNEAKEMMPAISSAYQDVSEAVGRIV